MIIDVVVDELLLQIVFYILIVAGEVNTKKKVFILIVKNTNQLLLQGWKNVLVFSDVQTFEKSRMFLLHWICILRKFPSDKIYEIGRYQ